MLWRVTHYLPDLETKIYYTWEEPFIEPNSGSLIFLAVQYPKFCKRWPKIEVTISAPYLVERINDEPKGKGITDGSEDSPIGIDG